MPSEQVLEADVLVIGGGLGGCMAALTARELGASVIMADKGSVGKSGASSFATGGYLAVFDPSRGMDSIAWTDWAVNLGEYINNREWLEIQLRESYDIFQRLLSWGVEFYKEGTEIPQFRYAPGINCVVMRRREFTPTLRRRAESKGVRICDGIAVTDLLTQDGRVAGAVGVKTRGGDFYVFKAKATILASGGGGFKAPNTTRDYRTADGEAMAYRAGAEITGKELHNKIGGGYRKYPYGACDAGSGPYSTRIYTNALGEDFTERYARGAAGKAYFRFSSALFFEAHAGRAPIIWDLDAVPLETRRKTVAHQNENATTMLSDRCGIDHMKGGKVDFFEGGSAGDSGEGCGGIRLINTRCETSLPGLYAVGDAAGTYLCGSSYNGIGHGLSNAALTGCHAGQNAALYSQHCSTPEAGRQHLTELRQAAYAPLDRPGGFSPGWMTQMIQNTMVPYYVLQVKHGDRLKAALTFIEFLKEHCNPLVRATDYHVLRMASEVRNMLVNAEMMLRASLFRTESRGAHYREDYPQRHDPDWLAWTVLRKVEGGMETRRVPIPREWWPDLTRPYEERYDWRLPGELEARPTSHPE